MKARPNTPGRPVGIKDIARALGVSIGTVDRALHDKLGVNPGTRARVLEAATALGYRPNLAARRLQAGTALRISVHLPRELALFWDPVRDGVRQAAALLQPTLQVEFRDHARLGHGDVESFREALEAGVHGLVVAPGDPLALEPWIERAARKKVPVVCVVTDAPGTERLTSVSADPFTVGAVAGELLARFLPGGGPVAFFTGWLGTQDHADKLRGFESSLAVAGPRFSMASIVEAHDDESAGYRQAVSLLRARDDLRGIYVSTVNSLPVLEAIRQDGRAESLTVVTTDLFPDLVPWIRQGVVAATVYQRPITQGRLAVQALYQFLLDGTVPPPRLMVVPHVVMRSNLDLVLDRLRPDRDDLETRPPDLESPRAPRPR
ncbi:MAG TPA: substrate-binding domain-containing protein [Vicinamibacterales bacterium]